MTASTKEPEEVEKRLLRRFISEDLAEKLLMKELKELRAENPQDCEEVDTTEVDEEMTPTEDREYEANKSPTVRQKQVPSGYQGTATDWLEAGLYDCALACEYEGIRPTLKTIRSMCYLLKKLNELPDWIFMSEQPIRSQGKVSKNFRLCEQDDEQTDILFDVKPPSYHVEQLDECSRSDLLGACLMALPVRCPKQGDWYLGLAGALREELVKKPRLYEIRCVIKTLEESGLAFVHDCGRWRCELVKLEAASEEKLVALGSRVDVSDRQRSFPAGAQPATQKKRKRGGKAKNPRARAKQTVPHLGLPYQ